MKGEWYVVVCWVREVRHVVCRRRCMKLVACRRKGMLERGMKGKVRYDDVCC